VKPVLVLGLGNPVAGDDGIGCLLAGRLAAEPELAERADVICAGSDIFRRAAELAGRRRVVLVDAALTTEATCSVRVLPHPPPAPERRVHAHALDPVAAITVLRSVEPAIAAAETWWLLVDVPQLALGPGLSDSAAALFPEALEALRRLVLELPPSGP
jgi:hydrogenase maturation protease